MTEQPQKKRRIVWRLTLDETINNQAYILEIIENKIKLPKEMTETERADYFYKLAYATFGLGYTDTFTFESAEKGKKTKHKWQTVEYAARKLSYFDDEVKIDDNGEIITEKSENLWKALRDYMLIIFPRAIYVSSRMSSEREIRPYTAPGTFNPEEYGLKNG
jgi:hypothetical protein